MGDTLEPEVESEIARIVRELAAGQREKARESLSTLVGGANAEEASECMEVCDLSMMECFTYLRSFIRECREAKAGE